MTRLEIATAILPWFLENSAAEAGKTWQQVAIAKSFDFADAMLKAENESKANAVDCRICARSTGQRDTQCASVYSCVNGSHYLPTKTVQLWRVG